MKTLLARAAVALSLSLCALTPAFAACPEGTVDYGGYCWVKPALQSASHSQACLAAGLTPTAYSIEFPWNETALSTLSAAFGYTSIGDYDNSATSMWCNDSTQQCGTHNYGNTYTNYGQYDGTWTPVYTCQALAAAPADVPVAGPGSLATLAILLAAAGVVAARRFL